MPFNPDYVPSGPNNKANEYYQKINNVRLVKSDYNKTEFFGTVGGGGGFSSDVPFLNSSVPMDSTDGWTDVINTHDLNANSVLYWDTNTQDAWVEQTVELTAAQQAAIADSSYEMVLDIAIDTPNAANDGDHRWAINVDFLDASDNYVGGAMRNFASTENQNTTLNITQWMAHNATKVKLQIIVDRFGGGVNRPIDLGIQSITMTLQQNATRKGAFLYANKNTFDTADFDILQGNSSIFSPIGSFGQFNYPGRASSSSQASAAMNQPISLTAEQVVGAQAGTAELSVQAYHFNENNDDRTRNAANQQNGAAVVSGGPDLPAQDAGERGNFRISSKVAVLTDTVACGAYYQGDRVDGTFNDGVISNFGVIFEWDNASPPPQPLSAVELGSGDAGTTASSDLTETDTVDRTFEIRMRQVGGAEARVNFSNDNGESAISFFASANGAILIGGINQGFTTVSDGVLGTANEYFTARVEHKFATSTVDIYINDALVSSGNASAVDPIFMAGAPFSIAQQDGTAEVDFVRISENGVVVHSYEFNGDMTDGTGSTDLTEVGTPTYV